MYDEPGLIALFKEAGFVCPGARADQQQARNEAHARTEV
jgi:hypothetical protein